MRLVTLPGVFRPPSDSWLLAGHLDREVRAGARTVLDVCTGSGILAVTAARAGAEVAAVDVSRRAVLTARLNARLNGTRVRALRGDLFAPVAGERFDLIVSNPPYLPGASDDLPRRGIARAVEGGRSGRLLIDRICAQARAHLNPGGVLLLVQSSVSGTDETLAQLARAGLEPSVRERRHGPLGPLLSARAEQLEARGLLTPGERSEELVVICAR